MNRLIISLLVLVVLTVMAISIYGKGKGGSNLRVIDANGLILGKVVGVDFAGVGAEVGTTVGGERVILHVDRGLVAGVSNEVFFKEVDNCTGQGFLPDNTVRLILTAIVDVDNSVYKVLDRNPALFESFTVESRLTSGGCEDVSFGTINSIPATLIGDLSEFTPPFEYLE